MVISIVNSVVYLSWLWVSCLKFKFVGFCKDCDQNGDRMSKKMKVAMFAFDGWKVILVSYEKYLSKHTRFQSVQISLFG